MQPGRRENLLSVLGVVQYRERGQLDSDEQIDDLIESGDYEAAGVAQRASVANSIDGLRAVADSLEAESSSASIELSDPTQDAIDSTGESEIAEQSTLVQGSRAFELRFWRSGHLLALETCPAGAADELSSAETKHRLVNNIYRAIYGAGVSGASMYSQSWPESAAAKRTDDSAASEWLSLFLKGQKAKDPDTQLWLMGTDAIELLLANQGSPDELEGMRVRCNKLDLDMLVTSSLDAMIAKPYLKASVWQLLRSLNPESSTQ